MVSVGGGKWQCSDCGYESQSSNVKRHIERRHIIPQEYHCNLCGKVLLGRAVYDNHIYSFHKQML